MYTVDNCHASIVADSKIAINKNNRLSSFSTKLASFLQDYVASCAEESLGFSTCWRNCQEPPSYLGQYWEMRLVLEQLRSAELVHQAMSVISDIQCRMASLQAGAKQGRYLDCIDEVVALDALFRRDLQLVKEDIQVLMLLRNLFITCKHSLYDAFLAMWSANFVFKERLERPLICSLTVSNLAEAPKLVRAFQALKLFHSKVDAQLADTLLSRFLLPVIADGSLLLECNAVNNQLELVLVDAGQSDGEDGGEGEGERDGEAGAPSRRNRRPPSPLSLCSALAPTLDTLRECLLSLPLQGDADGEANVQGEGDGETAAMTLADRLRPLMEAKLADRLVADCLAKTVPTDWAGLQAYGETAAAVERLEHQLIAECRLVSPNVSRLGEFVREIGAVFAEKRIAAILEAGRDIARRSLADSVLVDEAADAGAADDEINVDIAGCVGGGKEAAELVEKYIDRRAFSFPACRVSQSAIDLVDYISEVCRDAFNTVGCSEPDSGNIDGYGAELRCRIGQCCRKLLLLYRDTASLTHAEQLDSVPQLAALYYNNCHYLAHCAVDIEHRFVGPLVSSRRNAPPKCLVDAAAALRSDGARVFLAQLDRQRDLVLEPVSQLILGQQSSGGSYESNSRLCRQSLYQLECLARVWSVLPGKIRCKALGALAHCLLASLTAFGLAQEDFDSRDADDLAKIFQWVQERLAGVFAEASEGAGPNATLERFAPAWPRFCLLGRLLAAPLAAFPDLWCDGKSPLAAAFSDAEVRGVVKALFTNTDDRAAVLAKIN